MIGLFAHDVHSYRQLFITGSWFITLIPKFEWVWWWSCSLEKTGEPLETIGVSYSLHHTAHKQLNWSGAWVLLLGILAIGLMEMEVELLSQLLLLHGVLLVDFIAEDHKGDILELFHLKQWIQLTLGLVDSLSVCCVDHKDNTVKLTAILLPGLTGLQVTT